MGVHSSADVPLAEEVDAVMRTSRVLVGVIAASVEEVGSTVTVPQLRVLVMAADHAPLTLGAVAEGLGVHPSNATRTCDRLVSAGLLDRRDDPSDRRQLQLMAQMAPASAARLGTALRDFLVAAEQLQDVRSVAVWP